MRRLPLECFHEFEKYWKEEGLENSLKKLDTSKRHIAKTPECEVGMKVFEKYESGRQKRFLFTTEDHKKYLAEPKKEGKEPKYSSLDVHGGGIIMKRKHIYLVGMYCERYMAWGCHDADLQWKINNVARMEQFPRDERYEVLHLDHKRDHFDEKQWKINREIQKERKKKGVLSSIKEDKK